MSRQFFNLVKLEDNTGYWQFEDGTNIAWSVTIHVDTPSPFSSIVCAKCGAYKIDLCDTLINSGKCPLVPNYS